MLLQWMSSSRTARQIDRELGDLGQDLAGSVPALSYLRYNVDLGADSVRALDPVPPEANRIASLSAMDAPENMSYLHKLGVLAAARDVNAADFPAGFDLPEVAAVEI
jgi:uncharacterized protein